MNDKELIEEALQHAEDAEQGYASGNAPLYRALAKALEAKTDVRVDLDSAEGVEAQIAARQPSEDDREEVAKQLRSIGAVKPGKPAFYKDEPEERVDAPLSVVLDLLVPRAAVPDAATEIARILANATALTGQDARVIAEAAVKVAAAGEIAEDHARCDGRLLSVEKHAERMEAERDAALAAVERAAAIHAPITHPQFPGDKVYCRGCAVAGRGEKLWPCETRAALDGAPEPEVKP